MRTLGRLTRWCAAAFSTAFLLTIGDALGEPAINQFELKDLEAEPGDLQFQSQNAHSWGQPRRRFIDQGGGDFAYDDNSVTHQRHALEMQMALTHWFKTRVGIEFEKERVDDPSSSAVANSFDDLQFTEVAVEGILIFLSPKKNPVGLGLLAEFQHPVGGSEANTLFIGPIVQMIRGPWSVNANLMFVRFMGGDKEERDEKWDFSYATQLKYTVSDSVALALEAYGTIDRLGDTGRRDAEAILFGDHDQHRLGPVVYYTFKPEGLGKSGARAPLRSPTTVAKIDDDDGPDGDNETAVILGFGLLFGVNENTPDTTLKWSVEVEF